MTNEPQTLIDVRNLRIAFPTRSGLFEGVRGISFKVGRERVGIVGESGSGKSITGRSLMRLLPPQTRITADTLNVLGTDLTRATDAEVRPLRGKRIGLILQDPKFSLNPVKTVGALIGEVWRVHHGGSRRDSHDAAIRLLEQVRIRDPRRVIDAYPHELSGGMGQRVMIALMLAPEPDMLIADEPTSALDATVQAEILRLIDGLVTTRGMGLILISHDLPLVSRFCDRILVMYAGKIVEEIAARDLAAAKHPYTRGLLSCLPKLRTRSDFLPTLQRDPAWGATEQP
jgi:peptide/nickel transport system ATP-binding protein